jgi:hypothetical protein
LITIWEFFMNALWTLCDFVTFSGFFFQTLKSLAILWQLFWATEKQQFLDKFKEKNLRNSRFLITIWPFMLHIIRTPERQKMQSSGGEQTASEASRRAGGSNHQFKIHFFVAFSFSCRWKEKIFFHTKIRKNLTIHTRTFLF